MSIPRHPTFNRCFQKPIHEKDVNDRFRHYDQFKVLPPTKRRFESEFTLAEPLLVSLCRQEKWDQVLSRCETHPQEAAPRLIDSVIHGGNHPFKRERHCSTHENSSQRQPSIETSRSPHDFHRTALGIVCSSTVSSHMKLVLIRALLKASPQQLFTYQNVQGCTPLKDLIRSSVCHVTHLVELLKLDQHGTACSMQDSAGLTPIDHLVMRLHLDPSDANISLFCSFMDIVECFSKTASPIIRLLSLSRSPRGGRRSEKRASSAILKCTKYLLLKKPSSINDVSETSGCTVLHVALRNFGDHLSLIEHLLEPEASHTMLFRRNIFGDVPLHVACAVGTPLTVLKLILTKSVKVIPMPAEGPHPLLWCRNFSGYTAIELEWMRHIEGGGGLYERLTLYPLQERGLRCQSTVQEGLYRSLLRNAVDQVMAGDVNTIFFGALLDRLNLIVQMAFQAKAEGDRDILHAVSSLAFFSAPTIPLPLLALYRWMHNDKLRLRDSKGRLPLHYALMNHGDDTEDLPEGKVLEENSEFGWVDMLLESYPEGTMILDKAYRLPLHYALDPSSCCLEVVKKLLVHNPESVERRDPMTGLYPFQQAACADLDACFHLLRRTPHLVATALHND